MQLSSFLITEVLQSRKSCADRVREVSETVPFPLMGGATPVEEVLAARCRQVMQLCGAQSAGISMFSPSGFDTLTWLGVAGELAPWDQHVLPRDNGPCGVCFTYRAPQLFRHPHLYFSWMGKLDVVTEELLVVPIQGPFGAFFGTMWVVSHDATGPRFTADDVLVLERFSAGLWSRLSDLASDFTAPKT
jgi:hypothetical protein